MTEVKQVELGEIIATRKYTVGNAETGLHDILVLIGKPRREESDFCICPFQIAGLGADRILFAAGIDEMQSLILAIRMMAATLEHRVYPQFKGELSWEFGDDLDLDLVPVSR